MDTSSEQLFVKVAPLAQKWALIREGETLQLLGGRYADFLVPQFRYAVNLGCSYLVASTLISGATSVPRFPGELRSAIAARFAASRRSPLPAASPPAWTRPDSPESDVPHLSAAVRWLQDTEAPIAIAPVHGDLTKSNILKQKDRYWLIDWESSFTEGPVSVDLVANHVDMLTHSRLTATADEISNSTDLPMADTVAALVFLGARGNAAALDSLRRTFP
ncbi:hypothetical protein OHA21_30610 [Actinoplanes sp. NBC_00393]|uniref:phosphotransferase family protein n=1 Tax=Actinoplanes sp. NBC_00393 TaxID=2975953 RepID=UPI002E249BB2